MKKSNSKKLKTIFLDRDGTINCDHGYIRSVNDFRFLPHTYEGLKSLKNLGYQFIVVTNQGGIARGLYSEKDMHDVNDHMVKELRRQEIELVRIYYCPHHPEGVVKKVSFQCQCRKPEPGMLRAALQNYPIDLENSWMVGDKIADMEAGLAVGLHCAYVGPARETEEKIKFKKFKDLNEFAKSLNKNEIERFDIKDVN